MGVDPALGLPVEGRVLRHVLGLVRLANARVVGRRAGGLQVVVEVSPPGRRVRTVQRWEGKGRPLGCVDCGGASRVAWSRNLGPALLTVPVVWCVGPKVGHERLAGADRRLDELEAAVADLRGLIPRVDDLLRFSQRGDPDGAVGSLLEVAGLVVVPLMHGRGQPVPSVRHALGVQSVRPNFRPL